MPIAYQRHQARLGARSALGRGAGGDLAGYRPVAWPRSWSSAERPGTRGCSCYLERSGFLEETYHTFSYSPVYDDQSRIAGMLCVVTEVTERVIGERRLRVLRDLATRGGGVDARRRKLPARLRGSGALSPFDAPFFAALYLVESGARPGAPCSAHSCELPEPALPGTLALNDPRVLPGTCASCSESEVAQERPSLPAAGAGRPCRALARSRSTGARASPEGRQAPALPDF